jgi:hypothetical protein
VGEDRKYLRNLGFTDHFSRDLAISRSLSGELKFPTSKQYSCESIF